VTDALAHPGVTAATFAEAGRQEADGCLHAAVVTDSKGNRVWFPCRSHLGSTPGGTVHHFAAWWPACPAPWCRLPRSHYLEGTMHDIPGGTVEYHDAIGTMTGG
jgi:hypothetical protein